MAKNGILSNTEFIRCKRKNDRDYFFRVSLCYPTSNFYILNSILCFLLIAAIGKNRELGKNNTLLWDIPEDMKYFRDITRGHTVIMGQKTFESIGRPLPSRTNIVMTQDASFAPEGVVVAHSPEEALSLSLPPLPRGGGETASRRGLNLGKNPLCPSTGHLPAGRQVSPLAGGESKEKEIFIIGGASIYSLFLPQCDKLYLIFRQKRVLPF